MADDEAENGCARILLALGLFWTLVIVVAWVIVSRFV
jgi:hypothetical protein